MEVCAFFDIAARRTGWAVGAGDTVPTADAFTFEDVGEDLGALGEEFDEKLDTIHAAYGFTKAGYESPLLLPHDKIWALRRVYGLGMNLERWCKRKGIYCGESSPKDIKKHVTGDGNAKKPVVAAVIERLGIVLPATEAEGRYDAGDASGGLLISIQDHNPRLYEEVWAPRLYRARGGLLL